MLYSAQESTCLGGAGDMGEICSGTWLRPRRCTRAHRPLDPVLQPCAAAACTSCCTGCCTTTCGCSTGLQHGAAARACGTVRLEGSATAWPSDMRQQWCAGAWPQEWAAGDSPPAEADGGASCDSLRRMKIASEASSASTRIWKSFIRPLHSRAPCWWSVFLLSPCSCGTAGDTTHRSS